MSLVASENCNLFRLNLYKTRKNKRRINIQIHIRRINIHMYTLHTKPSPNPIPKHIKP